MMNKISGLIFLIVPYILCGCNVGATSQQTEGSKNITILPNTHNLKTISIGSPQMLGLASIIDKNNKDNNIPLIEKGLVCIDPEKFTAYLGKMEASKLVYISMDKNTNASQFFTEASIKGGFSLFKASANLKYANENEAEQSSLVISSIHDFRFLVRIDKKYINDLLTSYAKNLAQTDKSKFERVCGNGYVDEVTLQKRVIVDYKINFDNLADKSRFELAAAGSYGSFVDISAKLQKYVVNNHLSVKISISAKNAGGTDLPSIPTTCSIENLVGCSEGITETLNAYMKNNSKEFESLEKQFMGKDGSGINLREAIPLLAGYAYSVDGIDFQEFTAVTVPDIPGPSISLQEKRKLLEKTITLSAQVAANGIFIEKLQEISKNAQSEEFSNLVQELIDSSKQFSKLNSVITSEDFVKNMLNKCYQNDEKQCDEWMAEKQLQYDKRTYISINEYIAKLDSVTNSSLFKGNGYYSKADPNFANFYWLPIYDKSINKTKYYPISLNHNIDNVCLKQYKVDNNMSNFYVDGTFNLKRSVNNTTVANTKFDGLIYRDWNSKQAIVSKFLALPNDLYILINESSDGEISSITRQSNTMDIGQLTSVYNKKYNGTLICNKSTDYNFMQKNKIDGFECGEMYDEHHEAIMFSFYQTGHDTLKDALLNYGEKPFTSGNVPGKNFLINHINTNSTSMCDNIGHSTLNREQPWCTANGICLKLNDKGQIVRINIDDYYKNEEVIEGFNLTPINIFPMSVSISKHGNKPGMYYYENGKFINILRSDPPYDILEFYLDGNNTTNKTFGSGFGFQTPMPDSRYYHTLENAVHDFKDEYSSLKSNQIWTDPNNKYYFGVYKSIDGSTNFIYKNQGGIAKRTYGGLLPSNFDSIQYNYMSNCCDGVPNSYRIRSGTGDIYFKYSFSNSLEFPQIYGLTINPENGNLIIFDHSNIFGWDHNAGLNKRIVVVDPKKYNDFLNIIISKTEKSIKTLEPIISIQSELVGFK